MDALSIGITL